MRRVLTHAHGSSSCRFFEALGSWRCAFKDFTSKAPRALRTSRVCSVFGREVVGATAAPRTFIQVHRRSSASAHWKKSWTCLAGAIIFWALESDGTLIAMSDLQNLEFHRAGYGLLPDARDKDPGAPVGFPAAEGGAIFTGLCNCRESRKAKKCRHFDNLVRLARKAERPRRKEVGRRFRFQLLVSVRPPALRG